MSTVEKITLAKLPMFLPSPLPPAAGHKDARHCTAQTNIKRWQICSLWYFICLCTLTYTHATLIYPTKRQMYSSTVRVRAQVCLISECNVLGNIKCEIYPSMHLSDTSPLELGNSSPQFSPGYLQHTALECACGD